MEKGHRTPRRPGVRNAGPSVGIVLGSGSDRSVAEAAAQVLDRLQVPHEIVVASAHRDPDRVRRYAKEAEGRGVRVILAVAGLSAALPGVIASHTSLPVVGVPVPAGPLRGIDAILSMMQLPSGVPVGTVALGETGGRNGALLAARILALGDRRLRLALDRYRLALRASAEKNPLAKGKRAGGEKTRRSRASGGSRPRGRRLDRP